MPRVTKQMAIAVSPVLTQGVIHRLLGCRLQLSAARIIRDGRSSVSEHQGPRCWEAH